MASASDAPDPALGSRFLVEIDSIVVGGFAEVSGLGIEVEVETYREGGRNDMVHVLPVAAAYGRLVLQRGVVQADALWRWQSDVRDGKAKQRRTLRITLQDPLGRTVRAWHCVEALPVKWSGPELRADAAQVAVERLELAHNGLRGG